MTVLLEPHGEVSEILAADRRLRRARVETRVHVAQLRAQLGHAMVEARRLHTSVTQETIAAELGLSLNQVRAYESAYKNFRRDYPGVDLYPEGTDQQLQLPLGFGSGVGHAKAS